MGRKPEAAIDGGELCNQGGFPLYVVGVPDPGEVLACSSLKPILDVGFGRKQIAHKC